MNMPPTNVPPMMGHIDTRFTVKAVNVHERIKLFLVKVGTNFLFILVVDSMFVLTISFTLSCK